MIQLSALAAVLLLAAPVQETAAPAESSRMRITLQNGRVYTGDVKIDARGELTLTAKAVGEDVPLEFGAIRTLARLDDLGRVKDREVDTGIVGPGRSEYARLFRQQRIVGQLSGVDGESVTFASQGFGPLVIPRTAMGELFPLGGDRRDAVEGLDLQRWRDWKGVVPSERRGVSVAEGGVRLEKVGASIELAEPPSNVRVEFGVEWRGLPEFALRFGADEDAPRIEFWDGVPTLISRGEGGEFQVEQAEARLGMDSTAVFHVTFEEDMGRLRAIEVESSDRIECDLAAPLAEGSAGLIVEAQGRPMDIFAGAVRSLAPPAPGELSPPRVLRGSELTGFEPSKRILEVDGERMALANVPLIRFVGRQELGLLDQPGARPLCGQLAHANGEMIEIDGAVLEGGSIRVTSRLLPGHLALPLAAIQRLELPATEPVQLKATYEMTFSPAGEAEARGGARPITASLKRLVQAEGGNLELVRSEPGFKGEVSALIDGPVTFRRTTTSRLVASRRSFPHQVVLRSGETFPAMVVFEEDGSVSAKTPFGDGAVEIDRGDLRAVFIDPRRATALLEPLEVRRAQPDPGPGQVQIFFGHEVQPEPAKGTLTQERLERALLVPRAQVDAPGTYLLVAANGDLMRGTIVGQTDSGLEVQDHTGATMEIPLKVMALCVPIELKGEAEDQPEPEGAPWIFDLGGRALLGGKLLQGTSESFTVDHALLGQIELPTESAGLVTRGQPLEGRHDVVATWRAMPMPEPKLPD